MNLYELLSEFKEEVLYSFILGSCNSVKQYRAPYRIDKDPSIKLFIRSNEIVWHDMTTGDGGDIYALLVKTYKFRLNKTLKPTELLSIVYADITQKGAIGGVDINTKYTLDYTSISKKKVAFNLNYTENTYNGVPVYTKRDLKYWSRGFLDSRHLIAEGVKSANTLIKDGKSIWYYKHNDPIYVYTYQFQDKSFIKGYRPLHTDKKFKWISNLDTELDITLAFEGFKLLPQTGNLLLITKSKKDYMILKYVFGFNVISPQSENVLLHNYIVEFVHRFKYIILLYDNDIPGIKAMCKHKIQTPDLMPMYYPIFLGKDTYDVCDKHHNKSFIKDLLTNMINTTIRYNRSKTISSNRASIVLKTTKGRKVTIWNNRLIA